MVLLIRCSRIVPSQRQRRPAGDQHECGGLTRYMRRVRSFAAQGLQGLQRMLHRSPSQMALHGAPCIALTFIWRRGRHWIG